MIPILAALPFLGTVVGVVKGVFSNWRKWLLVGGTVIALSGFGWWQYSRANELSTENTRLEQVIDARDERIRRLRADIEAQIALTTELTNTRQRLTADYARVQGRLNDLMKQIPNIRTPAEAEQARKMVRRELTQSYACLAAATGNREVECK